MATADAVIVVQGCAACVDLRRGERLRVRQETGGQCADILAWAASDPGERFSASLTRTRESASPTVGARLWSAWPHERPLLQIVADTAPGHDLLHPACTPGEYASAGVCGEPACVLVQAQAVEALGLESSDLPDPLNLWFRPTLSADRTVGWEPTPTAAGDHVELRALDDVLVVVNPCVDDVFGCTAEPSGAIGVTTSAGVDRPIRLVGTAIETRVLCISLDHAQSAALASQPDDEGRARAIRTAAVRYALARSAAGGHEAGRP